LDGLWERLLELKITYAHDSRLATDYVSFDLEEERFRTHTGLLNKQNEKHINYCNSVINKFNLLQSETETQYELWAEFGKRLKLIEQITGPDPGFTDISLN